MGSVSRKESHKCQFKWFIYDKVNVYSRSSSAQLRSFVSLIEQKSFDKQNVLLNLFDVYKIEN